jgi:hypothetical protein
MSVELVLSWLMWAVPLVIATWRRSIGSLILAAFPAILIPLYLWQVSLASAELALLMYIVGIPWLILITLGVFKS